MITKAQTLPIIGDIMYVLPEGIEYTHEVFAFYSPIYGLKEAVETFRKWCLVHSFLRVARLLGCLFLHMKNKIENFLTKSPFLTASAGVFITLYVSHNLWAAYVTGALIMVVIIGEVFSSKKREEALFTASELAGQLFMFSILFLFALIPIAFLIQGEFGVDFVDKKTYHYYTSYDNQ